MSTHSNILAWEIPWTEEPGGLQSMGLQRVARQAPLSMGFPRQEYWSGLPFPSPGDLPNSEIEPTSAALAARYFTTEPPGKPSEMQYRECNKAKRHKTRSACAWHTVKAQLVTDYPPLLTGEETATWQGRGDLSRVARQFIKSHEAKMYKIGASLVAQW